MHANLLHTRRLEILGAIAGVIAVVVVTVLLSGTHGEKQHLAAPRSKPVPHATAQTPSGAAQAATKYLLAFSRLVTASGTSVRRTIAAAVVGPLKDEFGRAIPAVARLVRARLASTGAPAEFDGWPLAYRVEAFQPGQATVSIWHLDMATTSALNLVTADYATTTYTLSWVRGSWRVSGIQQSNGPTPPAAGAPATQMNAFARTVNRLSRYTYVP